MRKNSISSTQYISLKKASELSGYHPDYLSYLLRRGKIEGKRIGRDWFITQDVLQNYLLTKKFFPIKKILFSKIRPKKILFLGIAVAGIGAVVFLIFNPFVSFQEIEGDFNPQKLQTKNVGVVEVTTYSFDESGGIEVSIKPEPAVLDRAQENSFLQRIKNFFTEILE